MNQRFRWNIAIFKTYSCNKVQYANDKPLDASNLDATLRAVAASHDFRETTTTTTTTTTQLDLRLSKRRRGCAVGARPPVHHQHQPSVSVSFDQETPYNAKQACMHVGPPVCFSFRPCGWPPSSGPWDSSSLGVFTSRKVVEKLL
jgi:hypothetical protein